MTAPTTRPATQRLAAGSTGAARSLAAPVAMVVVGVAVIVACASFGLRSEQGIRLDDRMMRSVGSSAEAWMKMVDVLTSVTVASVAVCLIGCATVALLRGRVALAASAAVLIVGSNVTTQVLKYQVFERTDHVANSSPSGHTTVSLSIAVAAVLVAPAVWRWLVVPLAGFVATFVAAGTIVGQWHRPSDVVAAVGVVLAWTGAALAVVTLAQRRRRPRVPDAPAARSWLALVGSALVGLVFVAWGVRPGEGDVNVGLAVVALGSIGVAISVAIAWAASYADRRLA
ncbi:phosphatase PAP2 family protein [Luteipulveratus sp. YIM 133132]|uniref:Phosphatase PAP2 family protein n=1 Tax=Luteipulveratus flavus TaxID=3031728 RepID=A0ABT6C510_9MICO|nr:MULTISPECIES: phosphatase PAP2 family protein [unclassified Luteipulveratus]MDE9367149.1 phosphatase PAP2 family protein [Luteipulveratus sp. YIM 133132]MDF8263139.1 phosphatase PAP2 family protein [Luteipulveratus sp. YIM 133296]